MSVLVSIIIANTVVSLIGFIGITTLLLKQKVLQELIIMLVAFAAGSLMGTALLHLLPESIAALGVENTALLTLASFSLFYLIEKILHWRHCHHNDCKIHAFAYMNLIGDSIHNVIDGLIIAGTFMISFPLGISTTLAIILHEIPQELGDFAVLIHAGFSKQKALLMNVLVAFTALFGGIIGYFVSKSLNMVNYLLPLAAGGFLYLPAVDLIPEIRKEKNGLKSFWAFIAFLLGIILMYGLHQLE